MDEELLRKLKKLIREAEKNKKPKTERELLEEILRKIDGINVYPYYPYYPYIDPYPTYPNGQTWIYADYGATCDTIITTPATY